MLLEFKLKVVPFSDNRTQSISKTFSGKINGKVEISPSPYDTAWVAVVQSREYSGDKPCFPECLDWIIENQNPDGSLGLQYPGLTSLVKDSLSCTLACLLALRKWDVGHQLAQKGLEFIRSNAWAATDKEQLTPIGFDIVFPMMIKHANELDLTLPVTQDLLDSMFGNRDSEIKRLVLPTIYPVDTYTPLCMVDTLTGLGVDRYFQSEIDSILEETYRLWQRKEEEIFADITCCALAFRLLRIKGYEVSSDELAPYAEQEHVISLQMTGVTTVLELYRASQVRIYEEESTLEKLHAWITTFLKQQLLTKTILDKQLQKQVEYNLKNFHGILDRVGNRRSLDLYDIDHYQFVKAAYRCPKIYNEDLLVFSGKDFNICQAQHQKELHQLERLDNLEYGRINSLRISHFLTSAIFVDPELSDVRLSYAKTIVLVARMDDFLDHCGSREESKEIIELVKKYVEGEVNYNGSQEVEILFTALYHTVNELAEKAYVEQGRCVKRLLISLWVEPLTSFMKEMDSWSAKTAPTMDEYLSFSWVSISCRIFILTSIHFLRIKLSEGIVMSPECTSLCRHVSLKEQQERKLNSVSLQQAAHKGAISEEEAISKIEKMIEYNRRKLLQMVYQRRGSIVPRECKDVFWKTLKIGYYLYTHGDEFTSPQEMMEDMKSLIYEPLKLPPLVS
ncbi:hypothetical protein Pfo_025028 [Paulownia fortunei]|nr:hypothetical protein Pfo_025028 [Paulownia fortunei]